MDFKRRCYDCPDSSTCVELCQDIEDELAEYKKELRESLTVDKYWKSKPREKDIDEKYTDSTEIYQQSTSDESNADYEHQYSQFKERDLINLIDKHQNNHPPEDFKYDALKSNFPNINLGYVTQQEFNEFMQQLFYRRNYEDKKNKKYFLSFLKCSTLDEIAYLAGCTQQNMQKKFQGWLRNAGRIFSKSKELMGEIVTPAKFKKYLVVT